MGKTKTTNMHTCLAKHLDSPWTPTSRSRTYAIKTKAAWYQLACLKKVKPFLPESNFRTAVQSLVLSYLDGDNAVLHGFSGTTLALHRDFL